MKCSLKAGRTGEIEPTLVSDGRDITCIGRAIKHLPQNIYEAVERTKIATAKEQAITNRLAESEPLIRRALVIVEKTFGLEHPEGFGMP